MVRRSPGAPISSRERIGKYWRRLIRARFVPCAFRILRQHRFPLRFGTVRIGKRGVKVRLGSSAAVQAPADHRRFNSAAGFVIAPFAIDKAAGERQLIGAAVVLAKHLNRLIRRRFTIAIELSQTSLTRRHFLVPRCRLIAPAAVPPFARVPVANLNARMRFQYDILDARYQGRDKLTGMGLPT